MISSRSFHNEKLDLCIEVLTFKLWMGELQTMNTGLQGLGFRIQQ